MIQFENKAYDLEERTLAFAEHIIDLAKKIHKTTVTIPTLDQLIRSATSIGANYCEANGASSKKDFMNKIFLCKKESKETEYWLRLLAHADADAKDDCRLYWKEAHEFTLIFSKIAHQTSK